MKKWKNAKAIWDTVTDFSNPGWVIHVDEVDDRGEVTPMYYAPAPSVYYEKKNANKDKIIEATAKWENAKLIP